MDIGNDSRNIASTLAIGGWGVSGDWDVHKDIEKIQDTIREVFSYAYNRGLRRYDTAAVYGRGIVEAVLGTLPIRNNIFLSSKIPAKIKPSNEILPDFAYYDPVYMEEVVGGILARTNRSCIDLIQLHNWAPWWNGHAEYFLSPLLAMKEKGLVRRIGISLPDFYESDIDDVLALGILDYVQVPYNPYLTWANDTLFKSPKLGQVRLYVRSLFEQGLIAPALENAVEGKYLQDNRRGRCDLEILRQKTQKWIDDAGGSWARVQEIVMEKVRRDAGSRATLLISMVSKSEIDSNIARVKKLLDTPYES